MGSMVSGLAGAVLGVVAGVGLSADTVARYRKCCGVVVKFCEQRDLDTLSARVVEEFAACQQERARRGEIGRNRRACLTKCVSGSRDAEEAGVIPAGRITAREHGRAREGYRKSSPRELRLRPWARLCCQLRNRRRKGSPTR